MNPEKPAREGKVHRKINSYHNNQEPQQGREKLNRRQRKRHIKYQENEEDLKLIYEIKKLQIKQDNPQQQNEKQQISRVDRRKHKFQDLIQSSSEQKIKKIPNKYDIEHQWPQKQPNWIKPKNYKKNEQGQKKSFRENNNEILNDKQVQRQWKQNFENNRNKGINNRRQQIRQKKIEQRIQNRQQRERLRQQRDKIREQKDIIKEQRPRQKQLRNRKKQQQSRMMQQIERQIQNVKRQKWQLKRQPRKNQKQSKPTYLQKFSPVTYEKHSRSIQNIEDKQQHYKQKERANNYHQKPSKYEKRQRRQPKESNNDNHYLPSSIATNIIQESKDEKAVKQVQKQVPEYFLCPINQTIMQTPVILASCGHTFEQKTIRQWLLKQSKCPLCNKPSSDSLVIKNFALSQAINNFK